jgi:hypothetical protein
LEGIAAFAASSGESDAGLKGVGLADIAFAADTCVCWAAAGLETKQKTIERTANDAVRLQPKNLDFIGNLPSDYLGKAPQLAFAASGLTGLSTTEPCLNRMAIRPREFPDVCQVLSVLGAIAEDGEKCPLFDHVL